MSIVFTGDEWAEGGPFIAQTLKKYKVPAAFFLTGRFYRQPEFKSPIQQLKKDGHYLGAHSNEHLLYADWTRRDSLLVTKEQFTTDLLANYGELQNFGISKNDAPFFLPPYEWYNDSIVTWTKEAGLKLINFSPGTLSHTDYTSEGEKAFRSSKTIYQSIIDFEERSTNGLNGFILLLHIGSGPHRKDKFFYHLPALLRHLEAKQYQVLHIDKLLTH